MESNKEEIKSAQEESKDYLFLYSYPMIVVGIAMLLIQLTPRVSSLSRAKTKPFTSFEEFYPFYLSEHSNLICRRLHVVGTSVVLVAGLLNPQTFVAFGAAATLGFAFFPFSLQFSTGILEGVMVLTTFVILARLLTGKWRVAIGIPLCGYTFAWVGHFFFEHNRPATFIYPTFSLAGDFRMWWDVVVARSVPI